MLFHTIVPIQATATFSEAAAATLITLANKMATTDMFNGHASSLSQLCHNWQIAGLKFNTILDFYWLGFISQFCQLV